MAGTSQRTANQSSMIEFLFALSWWALIATLAVCVSVLGAFVYDLLTGKLPSGGVPPARPRRRREEGD